jgi:signal transduction histidine kinase
MPDIDGLETARLIRQYKKSAHTPIIFITAYADEMQTAQGYSLGAVDYILSPVIPDVLRSKVRVFVDLYQMQQRTRAMAGEQVARARAEAARAAAEETTRRSTFLARASHELGASLDLEQGMRRLLELVVPQMADSAALVVDGEADTPLVFYNAENQTRSVSYADLPEPLRASLQRVVREGLPHEAEVVCYPLRAGERTLGALALTNKGSAQDLVTLQELVGRAAIALDNARLYQSLEREIARSREAEARLQDSSQRKDEFLAMLSHELRNPLAPIRNAVEVIRRLAPPDPKLTMARDVVDRQVTLLARLVEELLDVSRISQGKIALKKEPVELSRIISHSVETARPLIDARAQTLTVSVPPAPVWLSADFARLSQVVANLLNNAAKYTGEGGRIELLADAGEGEATITVRDNGTGIEEQLLPKVFDLFVQGDRSLDRGQGGLGIGLTLVKRLVELHQGAVAVQSDGPGPRLDLPRHAAVHQRGGAAARAEQRGVDPAVVRGLRAARAGGGRQRRRGRKHRRLPAARGPRGQGGARRPAGAGLAQGVRPARGGARHRPARPGRLRGGAPIARARRHQPRPADRAHRLRPEGGPRARRRLRLRLPLRQAGRPARDPGRDRARPQHGRRALARGAPHRQDLVNTRTPPEALARRTEEQLEAELRDSRLLQEISAQLIQEQNVSALYEKILDAAVAIMRSDFASMQMLYPERGKAGELLLLGFRGFDPASARFWEWVRADSGCTCGEALRTGKRAIAAQVSTCEFMAGTADREALLKAGMLAAQSTPLLSRDGRIVGMISTHWKRPHQPSERDLRLLDILARQAADLIERRRNEEALQEENRRKDEFIAMLSHELRNPLAPIRNVVTLLQQQDLDSAELRAQACGILERQVGHLVRLVDDLLDVSRITRGTLGLQPRSVELAAIVGNAVETSLPLIDAAAHELELDLAREPLRVRGDPVRLAQLLTNILNNAARLHAARRSHPPRAAARRRRGGDLGAR